MSTEMIKIPPAKSLITGLRCIGYSFYTAVADIIDNSISAFAKNIKILSCPDDEPYVVIFDDGKGMTYDELENAMTLGSDRIDDDSELQLGRFGLGLKSASFSQCKELTVVSKKDSKINCMRYDLNKIEQENKWVLDILDENEIKTLPEINRLNDIDSGTLVIWRDFDKIEEEAKQFRDTFEKIIGNTKKHVELVFHRFYDLINIEFNGHKIQRIDPFLEGYGQSGRTQEIKIDNQNIVVTPFVLPFYNTLTLEHKILLGNPKSIYDDQGIYIYRNKRLIIWGSWLRMNVRSEFNKLARVRVDVPASLDSLWMLDVKKSSAKIPDKIKDQLFISIKDSIVRSKREVKYPGVKEQGVECPLWNRVSLRDGEVKYTLNRENNPIYDNLVATLNDEQFFMLNAYLDKVEEYIPKGQIQSDSADCINILNAEEKEEQDKLIEEVIYFCNMCNSDKTICLEKLLNSEAYSSIKDKKQYILGRLNN